MSAQLALYEPQTPRNPDRPLARMARPVPVRPGRSRESREDPVMCASCRAREARYGFRPSHDDDPLVERPRTLCFACFRVEMGRRQEAARAIQALLPLDRTLDTLRRRRRRAQIKARHALGLR